MEGGSSRSDPADDAHAQLVVVLDGMNLDDEQRRAAESGLGEFLRQNLGRLAHGTTIYRLSQRGLFALGSRSTDGKWLAGNLTDERLMRPLMKLPRDAFPAVRNCRYLAKADSYSLTMLGRIVLELRHIPGRKLVVWIGPGWRATPSSDCREHFADSFNWMTEFSMRMREARMALYSASIWAGPGSGDAYQAFAEGPKRPDDNDPGYLSLGALAVRSGGRVLTAAYHLAGLLNEAEADAGSYYTLSFDPPAATEVDEFHRLNITAGSPGLIARGPIS